MDKILTKFSASELARLIATKEVSPVDVMRGYLDRIERYDSDLNSYITQDTLITDVGSTKVSVMKDFNNFKINKLIEFVPGHPIAGLEKSGPEHGFEELFHNRYCILTPNDKKTEGVKKIKEMWEKIN